MTGPNTTIQPKTSTVPEPTLADLMVVTKKDINLNLNCHHVGIIQSFNPSTQQAVVSIAYKKTIFQANPATGVYAPQLVDYPTLVDVPVIVLGGGTSSLTFPIQAGDECLVLFNDRDIDNWFQAGQIGPTATPRLHSLADGFALVGIRSLNTILDTYSTTHATLQNGTSGVGVSDSLVKVYTQAGTLGTVMQQIMTQMISVANAAGDTGAAAQLTILAVTLGEILE